MKKLAFSLVAAISLVSAYEVTFHGGWQLKGAKADINVSAVFNNPSIISVWTYDDINKKWKVYLPNNPDLMGNLPVYVDPLSTIKDGEGYWVNALANTYVNIPDEESSASSEASDENYTDFEDYEQSSSQTSEVSSEPNEEDMVNTGDVFGQFSVVIQSNGDTQTEEGIAFTAPQGWSMLFNPVEGVTGEEYISVNLSTQSGEVASILLPADMTGDFLIVDPEGNVYEGDFEDAVKAANEDVTYQMAYVGNVDDLQQSESSEASSESSSMPEGGTVSYFDNLTQQVQDFNLSDVANKTLYTRAKSGAGLVEVKFDSQGNASFEDYYAQVNLKYDNGVIKTEAIVSYPDENGEMQTQTNYFDCKKLSQNGDDMIVACQNTQDPAGGFITFLADNNFNEIDVSGLVPLMLYDAYGSGIKIGDDGLIYYVNLNDNETYPEGNVTIEGGSVIVSEDKNVMTWDNKSVTLKSTDYYDIVDQVNQYYIVKHTLKDTVQYTDDAFSGYTWDELLNKGPVILYPGLYLDTNGTVYAYNTDSSELGETMGTYSIKTSNSLVITYNENFSETYYLDYQTGIVTLSHENEDYDVYSTQPIFYNVPITMDKKIK